MTLLFYKIAAAAIILLVTLVSMVYPIKSRTDSHHHHFLDWGDAFASGVFLGAALFHLLPEASLYFRQAWATIHYPVAELLCAGGFILLLFLERFTLSTTKKNHHATIPYILAIVIMVHSLIEGAVIGVNYELTTLSIIFVAVLAHKGSEGFALSATLVKTSLPFSRFIFIAGLFAVMTPIGILVGSSVMPIFYGQKGLLITAIFNAFAAGTFLYMSTLHHINHHQRLHEAESMIEFFCLLLGAGVMAVIAFWV